MQCLFEMTLLSKSTKNTRKKGLAYSQIIKTNTMQYSMNVAIRMSTYFSDNCYILNIARGKLCCDFVACTQYMHVLFNIG